MKPDFAANSGSKFEDQSTTIALLRPLLTQSSFNTAATEFLSTLAQMMQCERATLGFVLGQTVKISAVSRHYHKIEQTTLPEVIAAMEESILQDAALVYPSPTSDFPHIVIAHAELIRRNGLTAALTIPLVKNGKLIAAITLEKRQEGTFTTDQLWLMEQLASHVGPLLELKWQLERPFWSRSIRSIHENLTKDGGISKHPLRLIFMMIIGLFLLTLFLLPLPNRVTGQARLEASIQRVISAPIDGYLKEVRVRPGDHIEAGQLLAELNDEALLTEQRRLDAEILQQQNGLADAMVKSDRTKVVVQRAKLDEVMAQKDLIEQQLKHTKLTAPFAGVVIKGDLTQQLGTPIKRSDVLLTLSQGNDFRVLIEVSEQDIQDIKVGQTGTIVLTALPSNHFDIRIVRITPVANVNTDGQNTFEVEASINSDAAKLAPGLKGTAKIYASNHPIGWKWVMRAWNALSYAVWSRLA